MFGMLKAMKALGLRPRGDVILHIVIEEETGGNGTLAMVRTGERADCCVSLDAYDSNIYTSLRGAVWFTATIKGIAGHSAQMGKTVSALEMAYEVMRIMRQYRDELLDKTRGDDPLFANHPNPMPLTFGELHAGDWPAIGRAFLDSHVSMRDDFEISCPELDVAVTTAVEAGAVGARMTGGGFGGSSIALVPTDRSEAVARAIDAAFVSAGFGAPQHLRVQPGPAAGLVATA